MPRLTLSSNSVDMARDAKVVRSGNPVPDLVHRVAFFGSSASTWGENQRLTFVRRSRYASASSRLMELGAPSWSTVLRYSLPQTRALSMARQALSVESV